MNINDVKTISSKFVKEVKKKYPVTTAYLFGSYAKNLAKEYSDIDVCIVSPKFGKNYLQDEMELLSLSTKINSKISPVPFNPKDFADRYSQLAYEIKKYGIQV